MNAANSKRKLFRLDVRIDAKLKGRMDQLLKSGMTKTDIVEQALWSYDAAQELRNRADAVSSTVPPADTQRAADAMVADIARKLRKPSRAK
jgi:hypothetical protein